MTAAHDHTPDRPIGREQFPLRGIVALLVDVALPVALYYGLRAADVGQVEALLISGSPPALRVGLVFARTRRVDAIGAIVIVAIALSLASALIEGDARTLLIRNALIGFPFGVWMLASLRASRPLTYEVAKALLPGREPVLERAWAREPSFRRVWRRLTVLWGCGLLLDAAVRVAMAYTLPVDAVPGLETAFWVAMFVVLQVISQIALHRTGAMRLMFVRPA